MCRRYSPDHEDYWMLLLLHIHRNVPTRQQHSVASWMSTLLACSHYDCKTADDSGHRGHCVT